MNIQIFLSECNVFMTNCSSVEHCIFSFKQPVISKRNNAVVYKDLWFCLKAVTDGVGYVGQLKAALVFLSPAKTNHSQSLVITSKWSDSSLFEKVLFYSQNENGICFTKRKVRLLLPCLTTLKANIKKLVWLRYFWFDSLVLSP